MRIRVLPTDEAWFSYLRDRPEIREVNFWFPSPRNLPKLVPGDIAVFKSKVGAGNRLIGGGLVSGSDTYLLSEAWEFFDEGNGTNDFQRLRQTINAYGRQNGQPWSDDPTIGALLLHNVFWAAANAEVPPPPGLATSGPTRGKQYDEGDDGFSYLETALASLMRGWEAAGSTPLPLIDVAMGPTRGDPRLVIPRVGQQGFKALILSSYQRRCAITGSRIKPVLQAAHIRPVAKEGQHRLDNGLLLRSDVHTLFDDGYLGIDERYRLQVSSRLRDDFGNGAEFYERRGSVIALPERRADRPDRTAIQWHMDSVFRR